MVGTAGSCARLNHLPHALLSNINQWWGPQLHTLPPAATARDAAAVGEGLATVAPGAAPTPLALVAGIDPVMFSFDAAAADPQMLHALKLNSSPLVAVATARANLVAWRATASGSLLLMLPLLTGSTWLHLWHVMRSAKSWLRASFTAANVAGPACSVSFFHKLRLYLPLISVNSEAASWTALATAVASFIRATASAVAAAAARLDASAAAAAVLLVLPAASAAAVDGGGIAVAAATAAAECMSPAPQALSAASRAAAVHSGSWCNAVARCLYFTADLSNVR